MKAGASYQKKMYQEVPLRVRPRGADSADTVRISWPNGLIQNETKQAANKSYTYKEAQRLSGSCPMIWTWNGKGFQFITDVLGVAPLGASSGDGQYFATDHDEYIQIPSRMAARSRRRQVSDPDHRGIERGFLSRSNPLDRRRSSSLHRDLHQREAGSGLPSPNFVCMGVQSGFIRNPLAMATGWTCCRVLGKDRNTPDDFQRD